jgi:hypothetical protein
MRWIDVQRRSRRGTAAVFAVLTAAVCLLAVPAAHAALGFQGLSGKPANLAAGAHSNVDVHIGFTDPSDQVKDLTVHLPPGLVGNPRAAPLCTPTQLNGDNCPANSQVGSVVANVNVVAVPGALEAPLTVNGSLYNLVAHQGEPARFGIVLKPVALPPPIGGVMPKIIQQSAVKLRPSDYGLDTVVKNFPRTTNGLETDITSLDLSLQGTVNGNGFMRNPTSCSSKTFSFDAVSYGGHSVHGTAPSFTPTNCGALPFSPILTTTVGAGPTTRRPALTTTIAQDPGEAGLRAAKVLLAEGLGPNLETLNHTCPLARFRADASACPAASIVGNASAASPFVATTLRGPVVVVAPGPTDLLPRLGVDLQGPLSLQVLGSFVAESAGLGNEFTKLPDIPISTFTLHFDRGQGALLFTSINLCQAPPLRFPATFDGFNGAHRQGRFPAQVNGCG